MRDVAGPAAAGHDRLAAIDHPVPHLARDVLSGSPGSTSSPSNCLRNAASRFAFMAPSSWLLHVGSRRSMAWRRPPISDMGPAPARPSSPPSGVFVEPRGIEDLDPGGAGANEPVVPHLPKHATDDLARSVLLPTLRSDILAGRTAIFIDGKGDRATLSAVAAFAREARREDDLRCFDLRRPEQSHSYSPLPNGSANEQANKSWPRCAGTTSSTGRNRRLRPARRAPWQLPAGLQPPLAHQRRLPPRPRAGYGGEAALTV